MTKAVLNVRHLLATGGITLGEAMMELNGIEKENIQFIPKKNEVHVAFDESLVSVEEIKAVIESYGYPVKDVRITTVV